MLRANPFNESGNPSKVIGVTVDIVGMKEDNIS